MWEGRGVYRFLVGKPEGKRPLGRPRRRWEDKVRKDLQELGCRCEDWVGLAQDRDTWRALVSAVRNLRVPYNAGNFLTSCKPAIFSRRTLLHGVSKYIYAAVVIQNTLSVVDLIVLFAKQTCFSRDWDVNTMPIP
jgi:hypothetical protein